MLMADFHRHVSVPVSVSVELRSLRKK